MRDCVCVRTHGQPPPTLHPCLTFGCNFKTCPNKTCTLTFPEQMSACFLARTHAHFKMCTLAGVRSRLPSKILLPGCPPQPPGGFQILAPEDLTILLCAATDDEAKPSQGGAAQQPVLTGSWTRSCTGAPTVDALPWPGTHAPSPQDGICPGSELYSQALGI